MAVRCRICGAHTSTAESDQELFEFLIAKAKFRNTLEDVVAILGERVKKLSPEAVEKLRKFGVL